jgi:hypothetical protein
MIALETLYTLLISLWDGWKYKSLSLSKFSRHLLTEVQLQPDGTLHDLALDLE